MEFTCARPDCGKSFIKLRGWKNHMSRVHGGYDEDDVAQVTAGGSSSSEEDVQARMQAFAASLSPGGTVESAVPEATVAAGQPVAASPPPPPTVKTVKASPKKLKKILASIPQVLLENAGITLDEEDKEALEEAGEFLSDIFGVEFEVPQDKRVLHSRFWAIVWVGGVALLIYCKHRFADVWAKVYELYKKKAQEAMEKDV